MDVLCVQCLAYRCVQASLSPADGVPATHCCNRKRECPVNIDETAYDDPLLDFERSALDPDVLPYGTAL